jgi:hypothetical protein
MLLIRNTGSAIFGALCLYFTANKNKPILGLVDIAKNKIFKQKNLQTFFREETTQNFLLSK